MHLISVIDDTMDVYVDGKRVGEVTLMSDGWAIYRVTATGRVVERRLGTHENLMRALMALKDYLK